MRIKKIIKIIIIVVIIANVTYLAVVLLSSGRGKIVPGRIMINIAKQWL